jgi:hypothetical protein
VSASSSVLETQAKNEELAAAGRKLALGIYVILKSALLYDINNRFWERPLGSIEEVIRWHFGEGVGKPLALASLEKALFLNGTLVRLDASSYGAMRFVSRAFEQLGIEEIAFLAPLAGDDIRPLVTAFRDSIKARNSDPLVANVMNGIRVMQKVEKDRKEQDADKIDPKLSAVNAYANAAASCAEFRGLFLSGGNPSLVRVKRAGQELVTTAIKHPDLLVGLTQLPRLRGTAAGHMVNTAAYSLLLSRTLRLPRRSYGELALNAMLAPLGVSGRGNETVSASAESQGAGHDASSRVSAAVGMMRRYGAVARPSLVRSAIVYESAFAKDPNAQAYRLGMKPHLFSRVIAVASAYDLAMQDSLPDEALRKVVAQVRTGGLDGDVVALLSEVVGVYPVGSTVRLSDGTIGVVVQAPKDPRQRSSPVVRVLQGAGGRLLDLSMPGVNVQITATVPPESQQINVAHCFLL